MEEMIKEPKNHSPRFALEEEGEPLPPGSRAPERAAPFVPDPGLGEVVPRRAPLATPLPPAPEPRRRYAYRSPRARLAVRALDAAGGALFRARRARPEKMARALVMRPDHLGDVLFSLPALHALRERLPEARIDFLVGPWALPLLSADPKKPLGLEPLVFTCPWLKRPKGERVSPGGILSLARLLRRRAREIGGPYDLAIDLRGDFQLILAARLAGARYLVGRGITGLGFWLDREGEEVDGRHQVEGNLGLIEAAGFGSQRTENPKLWLSKEELEAGRSVLRSNGVAASDVLIGVHPGAGLPTKRWGAEKFARLIGMMTAALRARVVLLGGPDDRQVTGEVMAGLGQARNRGRVLDLCAQLPDLRTFMAVARNCALFVGNDSGPAHIAAALGVPLICLFSGTNEPAEWGPRGRSVMVIRKRIECEGCGLSYCDHHSCMVQLDVETVYRAVRRCVSG